MSQLSRREFVALTAGTAAVAPFVGPVRTRLTPLYATGLTAQDVIDRIKKNVGVEWKPDTVDTFKAGDPATIVTGVVTTSVATLAALRFAVKTGANLIITSEPTFYARADTPSPPPRRESTAGPAGSNGAGASPNDRVFAAKNELIKTERLVIWRFSDHWRARTPDPLTEGLADALGWSQFTAAADPARVSIPATTLGAMASTIKKKLNARGGIRVVGDPQIPITKVALLPGTTAIDVALKTLPAVDAIVAGEVREWESVEYARDTVTAGGKKGLILIGRVLSEEPAMNACARWLKAIVPELRTSWVAIGDPYWRPE
jgi:putative NIF3 family GTP cyclohydrolase 1 type 2